MAKLYNGPDKDVAPVDTCGQPEDLTALVTQRNDLFDAVEALLRWIEAVPSDAPMVIDMPAIDLDWIEGLLRVRDSAPKPRCA